LKNRYEKGDGNWVSLSDDPLSGVLGWMPVQAQQKNITLASSTSTQGSGLLDVLLSTFERRPAIL